MARFLLPPLIRWLLPRYTHGIEAGQVACLIGLAQCGVSSSFFLFTIRKPLYLAVWLAGCLVLFAAIGVLMPVGCRTPEGIAWLRLGVTVLLAIVVNGYLWWYFGHGTPAPRSSRPESATV
jgi:hypothetical protein